MALDTSIYFRTPIVSGPTFTERRAAQQQLRLRDMQVADAETQQRAAQQQAENEQKVDAIRLGVGGGGTLSSIYLGGQGAGQPPAMAGAMGQDGPQSVPATSLKDLAGLSVPGYAGGQYSMGGGGASPRTGQVNRYGGRSRQQIYDQIAQSVGPRQADAWLAREMDLDKGIAETSKEQAGAEEAWAKFDSQKLLNATAETQRAADLMANVRSQADLDQVRAQLAAEGNDDVDGIPEVYQPGMEQQWVQRAMGVVKAAELELEKRKAAETERRNQATETLTRRGQDITIRGQDISREKREAASAESGLPKPPPGYRYVQGGNLEPIPGGPAAQKVQQAAEKQRLALQGQEQKARALITDIDGAIQDVGTFTAGFGTGTLAGIRGTPAYNLERKLDTIKANLGFQELAAMRAASPTGGALGAVTERELAFLQSTVASLDAGQSPEELRRGLEKARQHYQNWLNAVRQDRLAAGGEAPEMLRDRSGPGQQATDRAPQVQSLYDEFGLED